MQFIYMREGPEGRSGKLPIREQWRHTMGTLWKSCLGNATWNPGPLGPDPDVPLPRPLQPPGGTRISVICVQSLKSIFHSYHFTMLIS